MLTLGEIGKKYNIVFNGIARYYRQSITNREYSGDFSCPYLIAASNFYTYEKSWGKALTQFVEFYYQKHHVSKQKLLDFKVGWTKTPIFSAEKYMSNQVKIDDGLFLSINFTGLHFVWLFQDLISFFNLDQNNCFFLIHRAPKFEPLEVQEYFEKTVKEKFINYLMKRGLSEEYSNKVANGIKSLNRLLDKMNTSFNNFYLFDDRQYLYNYKWKLLKDYPKYVSWTDKQLNTAKKYLDYYADFFKQYSIAEQE